MKSAMNHKAIKKNNLLFWIIKSDYLHLYLYFTFSSNINPFILINSIVQEDWQQHGSTFLTAASFLHEYGSKSEQCVFKRFSFTDYKTSLFFADKHIN